MFPEGRLRLVPRKHRRLSLFFILAAARSLPLRLGLFQLLFEHVLALDDLTCNVAVDRVHQLAFLEHFTGDVLAREEPAEIPNRHLLLEAVAGLIGKKADLLAKD